MWLTCKIGDQAGVVHHVGVGESQDGMRLVGRTVIEPSWRLKIARAERHLDEIKESIDRYRDTAPYELKGIPQSDPRASKGLFTLHVRKQPGPELAVIIGDFLFNLRSALDHLAVAIAPRSRSTTASFPMLTSDPWGIDPTTGELMERHINARMSFKRATQGMPREAIEIIKAVQPYKGPRESDLHALGFISSYNNIDKHQELLTINRAIRDPAMYIKMADGSGLTILASGTFADGAEIPGELADVRGQTFVPDVRHGVVEIAVRRRSGPGQFLVPDSLSVLPETVLETCVVPLEPFARS